MGNVHGDGCLCLCTSRKDDEVTTGLGWYVRQVREGGARLPVGSGDAEWQKYELLRITPLRRSSALADFATAVLALPTEGPHPYSHLADLTDERVQDVFDGSADEYCPPFGRAGGGALRLAPAAAWRAGRLRLCGTLLAEQLLSAGACDTAAPGPGAAAGPARVPPALRRALAAHGLRGAPAVATWVELLVELPSPGPHPLPAAECADALAAALAPWADAAPGGGLRLLTAAEAAARDARRRRGAASPTSSTTQPQPQQQEEEGPIGTQGGSMGDPGGPIGDPWGTGQLGSPAPATPAATVPIASPGTTAATSSSGWTDDSPQQPPAPAPAASPLRRPDPDEQRGAGKYTHAEFIAYYGAEEGERKWEQGGEVAQRRRGGGPPPF